MRSDLTKHKEAAEALVRDPDFIRLSNVQAQPNIFRALSVQRNEIRHSNFLSYLLDPNENHGLGDRLLREVLRDIFKASGVGRDFFYADEIDLWSIEVRREWESIDVLLVFQNDVILIENKIDMKDSPGQLERYANAVGRHFPGRARHLVYLTPEGDLAQEASWASKYVNYSYGQVVAHIESLLRQQDFVLGEKSKHYLDDYVRMMKEDVLMNTEENKLAQRLYTRHKDVLDFIIENRPDAASLLRPYFEEAVKAHGFRLASVNKGYVRFTTQALDSLDKRTGEGWPDKEEFLFEIEYFWSKAKQKKATFKAVASPSKHSDDWITRGRSWKHFKKPDGVKWQAFAIESYAFDAEQVALEDAERIREVVGKVVEAVCKLAKEIEIAMTAT